MKAVALALGLAISLGGSPARAAGDSATMLVLPFGFFDTSGEPRDQSQVHATRLAAMEQTLSAELEHRGLYRVASSPAGAAPCPDGDSDCLLKEARNAGAALVLTGAVQKVSTMETVIWVGAFAASDGKRVFYRQLSFRGDTDEAWQHATIFLTRQIQDDPPKLP